LAKKTTLKPQGFDIALAKQMYHSAKAEYNLNKIGWYVTIRRDFVCPEALVHTNEMPVLLSESVR